MTLIQPERVRGELGFEKEGDGSGRVRKTEVVREEGADGSDSTERRNDEGRKKEGELGRLSFLPSRRERKIDKLTEHGVSCLPRLARVSSPRC